MYSHTLCIYTYMYVYLCLACATVGNKDPSRDVAVMETTAWEDGLRATAGVIFLSTNRTWCQAVLCCEDCLRCTRTGMGRRTSLDATLSLFPSSSCDHPRESQTFFFPNVCWEAKLPYTEKHRTTY